MDPLLENVKWSKINVTFLNVPWPILTVIGVKPPSKLIIYKYSSIGINFTMSENVDPIPTEVNFD